MDHREVFGFIFCALIAIGILGMIVFAIQDVRLRKKRERRKQLEDEINALFDSGPINFFKHYDEYIEKVNEWNILTFGYPKYERVPDPPKEVPQE